MEVNNKTAPVTGQQDQNTISLDLMNRMKLHGMAEAFRESLAGTTPQSMTADTFLSMLLAREWDYLRTRSFPCSSHANGTIVRRLPLHGLPRMRHSVTRPILNRSTMPRTGGWTATRWNVSPPLILCIRHRTFSLPALPERGKAIWPAPSATKHAKGDSVPYMPMPRNCSERPVAHP